VNDGTRGHSVECLPPLLCRYQRCAKPNLFWIILLTDKQGQKPGTEVEIYKWKDRELW